MNKKIVILAGVAIVAIGAFYYLLKIAGNNFDLGQGNNEPVVTQEQEDPGTVQGEPVEEASNNEPAENVEAKASEPDSKTETLMGKSVGGRNIMAYHFGHGQKEILLIGGTHGGYSWNTALLGYQMADYLKANPEAVPANIKITVIPVLNPDGLFKVTGKDGSFNSSDVASSQAVQVSGRLNGNSVDINRNFDCEWKASGVWQNKPVSGGTSAFSEPESAAIRDYIKDRKIVGVVAWYSAAGGVFASSCGNGISGETEIIMNAYSKASGYTAHKEFNYYELSGDMTNWLAKNNIPAIGVMLATHNDAEWTKNWNGVKALLDYYSK